jgi:hypothetical protein
MHRKLADKYEKLLEYTKVLMDRLENVDPEILQHKPDPATWSPIQVLDHVVMAERVSNNYIKKKYNAIEEVPVAGVRAKFGCYAMKLSLQLPKKFKAPSYVNQPDGLKSIKDINESWNEVRTELREFLESYPDKYVDKALFKHPFVGRLSLTQMMEVHLIHLQRHEKQIDFRIKNFRDKPVV